MLNFLWKERMPIGHHGPGISQNVPNRPIVLRTPTDLNHFLLLKNPLEASSQQYLWTPAHFPRSSPTQQVYNTLTCPHATIALELKIYSTKLHHQHQNRARRPHIDLTYLVLYVGPLSATDGLRHMKLWPLINEGHIHHQLPLFAIIAIQAFQRLRT